MRVRPAPAPDGDAGTSAASGDVPPAPRARPGRPGDAGGEAAGPAPAPTQAEAALGAEPSAGPAPDGPGAPGGTPAPASSAPATRLVEAVLRHARLLERGRRTTLEVALDPPALGRVTVEATLGPAGLDLTLRAAHPEAVLVLAGALPALERALAATVGGPVRARLDAPPRPAPAAAPRPADDPPAVPRAPGALNLTV